MFTIDSSTLESICNNIKGIINHIYSHRKAESRVGLPHLDRFKIKITLTNGEPCEVDFIESNQSFFKFKKMESVFNDRTGKFESMMVVHVVPLSEVKRITYLN